MTTTLPQHLLDLPFPVYIVVFSCLTYLFGKPLATLVQALFPVGEGQKITVTGLTLDLAEKGSLTKKESLSVDEVFQLEKRAFFSKVCFCPPERSETISLGTS